MATLIDETGNRYGRLTVIGRGPNQGSAACWVCRCDCGGQITTRGYHLRSGASQSCGRCIHQKPEGYGALSALISKYKSGARQRGLEFDLSRKEVEKITGGPCHYCGREPEMVMEYSGCNGAYTYNSIDRKNSDLGYTVDNCVPCCKFCNLAKAGSSYEEFLAYLDRVVEHRGSK